MLKPLRLDNRRRHAGVVAIAFHQPGRAFRRTHATLRIFRAAVLGIQPDQHVQLRTDVDQTLHPIVADDLACAVRRAVLLRLVALDDLLDAPQMAGQRFVSLLLPDAARHRVGLDDRFRLSLRFRPSRLKFLVVVERQQFLILCRQQTFLAAMPVDKIAQQLPQLFHFDGQLFELPDLGCDRLRLLGKRRGLSPAQRLAGGEIVRDVSGLEHGTHDSEISKMR